MAVTSVTTDRTEYSRYEPGYTTVTVRGTCNDNVTPVTVTISRNDAYGQLAQAIVNPANGAFSTTFDLTKQLDQYGINRAIQGDYTASAVQATEQPPTASFAVSIVTVHEMKTRWLYGANLYASEVVLPLFQPRTMPGAQIVEVSAAFLKGPYPLVYTASSNSFSFAGGPAISVSPNTGITVIPLLESRLSDWVKLQVDTNNLPLANQTEQLILDNAKMDDTAIMGQVRQAAAWLENEMGFFLEPHFCVSAHLTPTFTNYEKLLDGAGFYGTFNNMPIFPTIILPTQHLLQIIKLQGWFNQKAVLDIPSVWYQPNEMGGNIELVPTSGQATSLVWLSFPMTFAAANYLDIPQFWQWAAICGMRDLNDDRNIAREAIAKKAGIEILLQAGAAYRAGIASRSLARDGVSWSEAYTQSAMYGIYSHLTVPWGDWLDKNVHSVIRRRLGGILMSELQ